MLKPIEKVGNFSPKKYENLKTRKTRIFNHWEGEGNQLVKLSQNKIVTIEKRYFFLFKKKSP
jgi:ribosomal protein S16